MRTNHLGDIRLIMREVCGIYRDAMTARLGGTKAGNASAQYLQTTLSCRGNRPLSGYKIK
jgi:hypothetical protein